MHVRIVLAGPCLLAVLAAAPYARAEQAAAEAVRLRTELEALEAGPAGATAPRELAAAGDLLRRAEEALARGDRRLGEGLLGLVPLQLRLVRELVRASELEAEADAAEREALEAARHAREAREALGRILERLAGRSLHCWDCEP